MQSVTFVDGHCARHVRRASLNVQSVTFADAHCAVHVRHASRNVQDNLGRPVPVAGLVGVDGLFLAHDGRVGFLREARQAGTRTPLCVVAISVAML